MSSTKSFRRIINEKHNWLVPLLSFLAITSVFLFFHEPWRDEVRDFALAIQSNSLRELIDFSQYDGHPALWYLILYAISKFTTSIFAVQIINILILTVGVYVFLQYAPIRWSWKLLIVFGYFFIYEYSVLFRSYATGITLLFIICELINREKIILASALIMIVVNANLFAFLIGGVLWLICLLAFYRTHLKELIIGTILVLLGALRSMMDTVPPKDYGISIGYQISFDGLMCGAANIWRAFVPVPMVNINYWNSNFVTYFFDMPFANYVMAMLSILIVLGCLSQLRQSSLATIFFLLLTGGIVVFTGVIYPGSLRHHGHLYITFILALWLKELFLDKNGSFAPLQNLNFLDRITSISFFKNLFPFIFYLHILAGGIAYFLDGQYSFSRGKEVAAYLQKNKLTDKLLIGHYDANVSTISAYLNQEIYFPQSGRYATFIIWDRKRLTVLSDEDLLKIVSEKKKESKGAIYISSTKITDKTLLAKYNIKLLKAFEPSVIESYFLYE